MQETLKQIDASLRLYLGIGLLPSLVFAGLLALGGVAIALLFPKFEAKALLQFPEAQKLLPPIESQRMQDPKANVIELAAYKRVAASYDSPSQLRAFLEVAGLASGPSAERLLKESENPGFWMQTAVPILPFSRRDQREFGDIKDASATAMLGLELTADARTPSMAQEMIEILAAYFTNAVVRERVRAWTLEGKVDAQSQDKIVQADILKAELDIELYNRRVEDMKSMLARYPDASRMDSRQLVSVSSAEGGERYLSPLAQLVGAESAISQRRELIRRWQRDLKQKTVLAEFYAKADALLDKELDVRRLLAELRGLAKQTFSHADASQEWNQEASLRVNGAIDNFQVMSAQFGVRNGIRVNAVASRSPWRLAGLGLALGFAVLGAIAFLRMTVQSTLRQTGAAASVDAVN